MIKGYLNKNNLGGNPGQKERGESLGHGWLEGECG